METYRQERAYLEAERSTLFTEFANSVRPEPKVKSPKYTFGVAFLQVVVGQDEEGDVIGERYFMVATDARGRQVRFGWEESEHNAEFVFVQFAPAVSEWTYWRCEYGSLAYQQDGCELDQLRSEMEFDLGPDWMNHPQVSLELRTVLA